MHTKRQIQYASSISQKLYCTETPPDPLQQILSCTGHQLSLKYFLHAKDFLIRLNIQIFYVTTKKKQ